MSSSLDGIESAFVALAAGRPVLVVDAGDRENEGDIVLAAQFATPEWVGWSIRHSSGVLCVSMLDEQADHLALAPMVTRNQDPRRTAYTVSVDARTGVSTGISASDRARTIGLLADATTTADDLVRPGHVFPLRARAGGVLERPGHTEAGVDLCRIAGLAPVAMIVEVVGDDGEPLRLDGLRALADATGIPLVSIADLIEWRRRHDIAAGSPPRTVATTRVRRVAVAALPTRFGEMWASAYRDTLTGDEHLAVTTRRPDGGWPAGSAPLVRVHSECLTGDTLGSLRCDCGPQLDASLSAIAASPGGGALVYLRGHEGRGIGLAAKIAAYQLQDQGLDTVDANTAQGLPADARDYVSAAAILVDLGLTQIRLLTNNPTKVDALVRHGVSVTARVPVVTGVQRHNIDYLITKRDRMGHLLPDTFGWFPNGATDEPGARLATPA